GSGRLPRGGAWVRRANGVVAGIPGFVRRVRWACRAGVAGGWARQRRPPVPPGDEAQIDYGFLGSWLDPVTERVRRLWAFVMVLAASRHMFVRPVIKMDAQVWVACHVAAFEFFEGVPARLVPDNLKTGVDRPDLYDPKVNRAYADLAAHYGCLIDPARRRKPKDKPRVERPMPYVRDSFWRGRKWESFEAIEARSVEWCLRGAGPRH